MKLKEKFTARDIRNIQTGIQLDNASMMEVVVFHSFTHDFKDIDAMLDTLDGDDMPSHYEEAMVVVGPKMKRYNDVVLDSIETMRNVAGK